MKVEKSPFPMPYPTGQLVSAPLSNGFPQADFGTHISYLGVGGYREVPTLTDRNAIPTKAALEYDGLGSGQRRHLMQVAVQETGLIYILNIPNFATLTDAAKITALKSNSYWADLKDFLGAVIPDTSTSPFLVVQGYGQAKPGQRGSFTQPYASPSAALNDAREGDTIIIYPGGDTTDGQGRRVYSDGVGTSSRNITVQGVGNPLMSGYWVIGDYPGSNTSYKQLLRGIQWTAGLAVIHNAGANKVVDFEDCKVTDNSSLFLLGHGFDIGNFTPGTDNITFRRCEFNVTQTSGNGPFRLQSRDDAGDSQNINVYIDDCRVKAAGVPLFTGYVSATVRFYFQGTTRLKQGNGQPLQTVVRVNTSTIIPDSEFYTDERAVSSSGGGAGANLFPIPEFTATQDGAQNITLPTGATGAIDLNLFESAGGVRPIYQSDYTFSGGILTILADTNIKAGDKIQGSYYVNVTGGTTPTPDPGNGSGGGASEFALLQVTFGNGQGTTGPTQEIGVSNFYQIAFSDVLIDSASGWVASQNRYIIPAGQAGVYECYMGVRLVDNFNPNVTYGFGIDRTAQDSPRFNWRSSSSTSRARNGSSSTPTLYTLAEGESLIAFAYIDAEAGNLKFSDLSMVIKRIR